MGESRRPTDRSGQQLPCWGNYRSVVVKEGEVLNLLVSLRSNLHLWSQGVSSDRRNETVNAGGGGWQSTVRAVGGSGSGIWWRHLLMSPWGGVRDPGTDRTRCRNIFLEQMSGNASVTPWRSWWGWTGRGQVTWVDGVLNVFSDLQGKKTFTFQNLDFFLTIFFFLLKFGLNSDLEHKFRKHETDLNLRTLVYF